MYFDELEADFQQYYNLDLNTIVKPADRERGGRLLLQLPRNCRTFRTIQPANQWGWDEVFANKTNYLLELMLWQNTQVKKGKQAEHKRMKPKPFVPDFMKQHQEATGINKGIEVQTVDDVKSWLAVPRGV